jgi:hypothetical protein
LNFTDEFNRIVHLPLSERWEVWCFVLRVLI